MTRQLLSTLILALAIVASCSAQTTPNLGLNIPPTGLPNWGSLINQDMSLLDGYVSGATTLPGSNTYYATACAGTDIVARANACASALTPPGKVIIPPGTYIASTTLNAASNITFEASGVTINFTPTTGNAILVSNVHGAVIRGPLYLNGPSTGTGVGIYLGSGTANSGLTVNNAIYDVHIGGGESGATGSFYRGIVCDGNVNAGTYTNNFHNVTVGYSLNVGWYFVPTSQDHCNANVIDGASDSLFNASDGVFLNGTQENQWHGFRSESNGGFGWNIGTTVQTNYEAVYGGHSENNTSGDINLGANANETVMQGISSGSTIGVINSSANFGNQILPIGNIQGQSAQYYGYNWLWTANNLIPNSSVILRFYNAESPPSTFTNVLNWQRVSANNGFLSLGTPEYPLQFQSKVTFQTGIGAIPQLIGPTDQPLQLATQNNKNLLLNPNGSGQVLINGNTAGSTFNSGTGIYETKRAVAGCATGAAAGAVCTTTITWPTTMTDANYAAYCTGDTVTSGVPVIGAITSKTATAILIQTVAITAAAAQFTSIECLAVHD